MKALLNNIKIDILSWLLHHANRAGKDENFYQIKNRILAKYSRHLYYDVQFIEGIKCHNCNGTGRYKFQKYDYATGYYYEPCYSCYNGWYKRPRWNILARVAFGEYEFHRPMNTVFEKPEMSNPFIEGYIEHTKSKYTKFAKAVLFLLYEKGYLKRWWKETGNGWPCYWYWPRNWVPSLVHIIKNGKRSYPFRKIRLKRIAKKYSIVPDSDDLPF